MGRAKIPTLEYVSGLLPGRPGSKVEIWVSGGDVAVTCREWSARVARTGIRGVSVDAGGFLKTRHLRVQVAWWGGVGDSVQGWERGPGGGSQLLLRAAGAAA